MFLSDSSIGATRFKAIVKALKSYCKNNKGNEPNIKPINFKTGRLFSVMRKIVNGEQPPKFDLNVEEQIYIFDFKFAVEVLPQGLICE